MTTWKSIPGWVGLYEASDDGQVRSISRTVNGRRVKGRVLKAHPQGKGYLIVVLSGNGRRVAYAVHRLVSEAFLGPLPDGMQTRHLNGDNQDNRAANLRYGTQSENQLDVTRHGRNRNANKTHCPQGHEYTLDNLVSKGGAGGRRCKTCHRERNARRRARQRLTTAA